MILTCQGGPLDGQEHHVRDDLKQGEYAQLRVPRLYDPNEPVYLPYDDPRNNPTEQVVLYRLWGGFLTLASQPPA